jgi:hypothetical protein
MPNQRPNEDQEQMTDDEVVGKAVGEDEEFEDADELDESDDEGAEEDSEEVGEE